MARPGHATISAEAQSHKSIVPHNVKRVLAEIDAGAPPDHTIRRLPLLTAHFWRIPAKPVGILRLLRVRTCYNSKKSNVDSSPSRNRLKKD